MLLWHANKPIIRSWNWNHLVLSVPGPGIARLQLCLLLGLSLLWPRAQTSINLGCVHTCTVLLFCWKPLLSHSKIQCIHSASHYTTFLQFPRNANFKRYFLAITNYYCLLMNEYICRYQQTDLTEVYSSKIWMYHNWPPQSHLVLHCTW